MMTPQLFINYKLKSVAHLPWRMMTYKALNTFIDDIFAFVIKMPTLYRIGCFRDGTNSMFKKKQFHEAKTITFRRYHLLHFPVSTLDLPSRSVTSQRIWSLAANA